MGTGFSKLGPGVFVLEEFRDVLEEIGIRDMDSVFAMGGEKLDKANLAGYRSRVRIQTEDRVFYLKRFAGAPLGKQVRNWISHGKRGSFGGFERWACEELRQGQIGAARAVAWGEQWGFLFERRSFVMLEEVKGESLERHLPAGVTGGDIGGKREFIEGLAGFLRSFHGAGFVHRDMYLCHIFYDGGEFRLIDLGRVFRPGLFGGRWIVKDWAALFYSMPGEVFSKSDRLRFFMYYRNIERLGAGDKRMIKWICRRMERMAQHDEKHGRLVPFRT